MFDPENPPELDVVRWLNTEDTPTLAKLKGKVVILAGFQMLCGGSAKHGLPQAERISKSFSTDEVVVIGVHMPFENHDAQKPGDLKAFIAEQDISIAVAIDKPNGKAEPKTMKAFEIQGTPTVLVFDRQGRLRRHYLGTVDDIRLGAEVMALAIEDKTSPREFSIAIERKLASVLIDPGAHDHGDACGCGHDHHSHNDHGHSHDHGHGHGHNHHDHDHKS